MFWKKSNKKNDSSAKLFSSPNDGRNSFRVTPALSEPLKATLNDKNISIINISSGGFQCGKNDLAVGNIYSVKFILPPDDNLVTGSVEILENNDLQQCRCRFLELKQDFVNLIHLYVLNRQKEDQELKRDPSSEI